MESLVEQFTETPVLNDNGALTPSTETAISLSNDERELLLTALMLVVVDDHIVTLIDPKHLLRAVRKRKWWRDQFDRLFDEVDVEDQARLIDKLKR